VSGQRGGYPSGDTAAGELPPPAGAAKTAQVEIRVADLPQVREALDEAAKMITALRGLLQEWEPRVRCLQCGRRYHDEACGPTHAIVWHLVKGEGGDG
jgi:hypothetical protein